MKLSNHKPWFPSEWPRNHHINQPAKHDDEHSRPECLLVHLIDNLLIILDIASNQLQVFNIRTLEYIQHITYIERYGTYQHIHQDVIDDSQSQRNRLNHAQTVIDEWECKHARQSITDTGRKDETKDRIQELLVHILRRTYHQTI